MPRASSCGRSTRPATASGSCGRGPRCVYCLRDLKRTEPGPRSPRSRVFPKCSQDPRKRTVTLGTSVGWSDVYPSKYYQQWIDVTGLRGCFAYVHRADPKNHALGELRGKQRRAAYRAAAVAGARGGCP